MTRPLFLWTTLAALSMGGMAQAQETQNSDVPVLDMGTTVSETDQAAVNNQAYTRSEHGDWKIQCLPVAQGGELCQMNQVLFDDQGGRVADVLLFPVIDDTPAVAGAVIQVPLEILLTGKLSIQIDSAPIKLYEYSYCTPVSCVARPGFTENDIAAFKRGNTAKLSVVPVRAPNQRVAVNMSLTGFTAAFNEVTELEKQR